MPFQSQSIASVMPASWLQFDPPGHIAGEYDARTATQRIQQIRSWLWVGMALNLAFLFADAQGGPALLLRGIEIRILLLAPLGLASIWLVQRRFSPAVQAIGSVLGVVLRPLSGEIAGALVPAAMADRVFIGTAFIEFWLNLATPLRPRHAALAVALQIASFDFAMRGAATAEVIVCVDVLLALSAVGRCWIETAAQRRFLTDSLLRDQARELEAANATLARLAKTDPVTGAFNRRFLDSELARVRETSQAVAVIMLNIDHFKALSDACGHEFADHCLQRVALALKANVRREIDTVARYGGEKFVLVLPDIDPGTAHTITERIRRAVSDLHIPGANGPLTVSAGGVWTQASHGDVIGLADQAMYQARQKGGNLVSWN